MKDLMLTARDLSQIDDCLNDMQRYTKNVVQDLFPEVAQPTSLEHGLAIVRNSLGVLRQLVDERIQADANPCDYCDAPVGCGAYDEDEDGEMPAWLMDIVREAEAETGTSFDDVEVRVIRLR